MKSLKITVVLLFVVFLGTTRCQEKAVRNWSEKFDYQFYSQNDTEILKKSTHKSRVLSFSRQGNSFNFMHLGPVINSLSLMYINSKDEKYLNSAFELINNIIGSSQANKNSYQSWIAHSNDPSYKEVNGKEWILFEAHLFRYVLSYLYLVEENKSKIDSENILASQDKFISFIEKNIWKKWVEVNNRNFSELTNLYGVRTHIGAQWAQIALLLSRLTKNSVNKRSYLDFVDKYNLELKKNLKIQDGCYIWNSTWDNSSIKELRSRVLNKRDKTTVQDVAHANQIIEYVILSNKLGSEWTKNDIKYFANTFKSKIYDKENKLVSSFVDGSGKKRFINLSDGWMKLGEYDKELLNLFKEYSLNNIKNLENSPYSLQFFSVAKFLQI